MKISNIIFDWDGTLVKSLDLWLDGYLSGFAKRGHEFSPEFIVKEFFYNHHEVPDRHPDLDFPPIAADAKHHVFQGLPSVSLYDGVKETLAALTGAGVGLSLVTSSPRHVLQTGLDAGGVEQAFASTLAGDDGFGHKPDTRPFAETLDRMGATAAETLIIGDAKVDIAAGQALGCQTCWFAPEQNQLFHDFTQIRAMGATHEISAIPELTDLI